MIKLKKQPIYIKLTSIDAEIGTSKKNRIISAMSGQFQSGCHFRTSRNTNRNLWRIKLMNNKGRIIIGVTIGITAAILLWSVVFINVLNSMAGIGIRYVWVYLLVYPQQSYFSKKIKINDDTTSSLPTCPLREGNPFLKGLFLFIRIFANYKIKPLHIL